MAGIDPNIALGVQQPNSMQTLSSLIGLKTQLQGQQLQQQQMQSNSMANQQSAIDLQETQNAQGLLKNIKNYQDPQGNIDFNKLAPDLASAAPKNFAKFMQPLLQVQQAHTEASQSINTLDAQSRGQVGSVLYSLKGQPPDVVAKTLDTLSTAYPTLAPAVGYFQKQIGPALAANSQTAIDAALDGAGKQLVPPQTQQGMNTPDVSMVPTASGTQPYNTKVGAAVPVGPMGSPLTPPNQAVPTIGGGTALANPATGTVTALGGTPSGAPGAGPQVDLPPGETRDTLAGAQAIRQRANAAATTVPQTQFNSNQIIKYADEADIGKGSQILQKLGSIPGISDVTDKGTNMHVIQHYLTLQQANLAQQAGLANTNSQTELAGSLSGTTEGTPEALKSISRVNRALSTGVSLFNNGVEQAAQRGGPFAVREFQNQWSSVADVNAMRLYDAKKNQASDPEGYAQVVKQLGGVNSPQFKATLSSVDKMRAAMLGQQ